MAWSPKCFLCKHEDPSKSSEPIVPQTYHISIGSARERRIPESHWADSLIQSGSPMFSRISYLKRKKNKEPQRYLLLIFIPYMYTCAYSGTQSCTHANHTFSPPPENKQINSNTFKYITNQKKNKLKISRYFISLR